MTKTLMLILIIEYIIIGIVALAHRQFNLFGYWIMAAGLNYFVWRM